jgi:hypothetical protein
VLKEFQEYERLIIERARNGRKVTKYLEKPDGTNLFFKNERVKEIMSNTPKSPSIQNLSMLT